MTVLSPKSEGNSMKIQVVRRDDQKAATAPPLADSPVPRFENQRLIRQFELAASKSVTSQELFQNLSRIICSHSKCAAVWVSQPNSCGRFLSAQAISDENADLVWETVSDVATSLLAHIQSTQQITSVNVNQLNAKLVGSPIHTALLPDQKVELVMLACFSELDSLRLQWLMGIASQTAARWFQNRRIQQLDQSQKGAGDALSLIFSLDKSTGRSQAARLIVNQLRNQTQSTQVALCLHGKLVAISDVEQIDAENESNRVIERACVQAEEAGKPIRYLGDDSPTVQRVPLQAYVRSGSCDGCLCIPMLDIEGKPFGAVLFGADKERIKSDAFTEQTQKLVELTGGHVDVVLRANRSSFEVLKSNLISLTQHRWRKIVLAVACIVTAILATPVPYRVGCDCELQPVLRRFVAAPYEGVLEKTLVENGDLVSEGDLLARMDGRSVRIELAGLEAELAGARKRKDSALAAGDIAKSQIARSEMERFQANIDLLQQKTRNLEVISPIDGIIVSGDLEKVEGAPLEMGQTMFEVAPLEEMVAEVAIPESEIGYVEEGMEASIKLSAFPFRTFQGQISKIHPRAEIYEEQSVFIAQVVLANEENQLRPGMKGAAKVKTFWAPLGWNLFHRSWEAVRCWTVW